MLQKHVDPHFLSPRSPQGHQEDQVALLLPEIGRDEAAVLAPCPGEVDQLGEGGLQDLEELAQLARVLEESEGAAVVKLAHGQ